MLISRKETFKRKKIIKIKRSMLIVCLATIVLQTSCTMGGNQQTKIDPAFVQGVGNSTNYHTVEKGTAIATLIGNGKLVPTKTTSLYFSNVSGPLEKLNFGLNDYVKKDDLFAEIKPTDIQNRIELQRIAVEKGKARVEFLNSKPSETQRLEKSIELTQIELTNLLEKQNTLSDDNKLSLEKAQLALEQLQLQMDSSSLSKKLIELEYQLHEGTSINDTNSVHTNSVENDINLATETSSISHNSKNKAELLLAQAEIALESIQKSIDIATLTIEQTSRSNDERVKATESDVKKIKNQLEQLKLQVTSQMKDTEYEKLQASYDQQSAELSLKILEESLENSKLYSPVDGIVSYLNNVSITDIIASSQVLAKIADPNELVFQFSAVDAQYISDVNRAVLTIGVEKYDVEIYNPQPGDSFLQNNSTGTNNTSILYLKFKGTIPDLKFDELAQAQLDVEKDNALLIPKSNVRVENGKILVELLKDNEIVTTQIIRGIESDTSVEVVNGLKLGDRIVIR